MASSTVGRVAGRVALTVTAATAVVVAGVTLPPRAVAATGVTTGLVSITGSGFGHGVGMSQYGALGMARAGSSVTEILSHYYTDVDVAPYRDAVDVRVNVVHGGSTVTLGSTARATGGGGLRLVPDAGTPVDLAAGDAAVLQPSGGQLKVTLTTASGTTSSLVTAGLDVRWPGTRLLAGAATTADLTATIGSARKSRSYRWGSLRVTPVGSLLDAVAVVDLHGEYLRGVAEMPSSWPAAALQAQVVAARNYALLAAQTTAKPSCGGCHLWDDTRSQVYTGWAKESETIGATRYGDRWVAAVTATQSSPTTGLSVLYQGRPVATYFASSTGGRTRDPVDVWGTAVPYLASVADPWSADPAVNPGYAHWTRQVSVARLLTLFGLPDLASLAVTSRDSGGAAKAVTATSADGAQQRRTGNAVAGALGLPGAWITALTLPGAPTPDPTTGPTPSPTPRATPSPTPGSTTDPTPHPTTDPTTGPPPTPTGTATPGPAGGAPPPALVPAGLSPVQWQPGPHTVNGRAWSTRCETYSRSAHRCLASIRATTYAKVAGVWTARTGWVLNNTAYFDATPAAWAANPYATPGERTVSGRRWRTTCSAASGPRTCTTWVLASPVVRVVVGTSVRYLATPRWMLNNHVYLS